MTNKEYSVWAAGGIGRETKSVDSLVSDGYVKTRLIVCAAIRFKKTGSIVCGVRHYDGLMLAQIARAGGRQVLGHGEQGFVDQKGIFLNREEAYKVAYSAGQLRYPFVGEHSLFSENLY